MKRLLILLSIVFLVSCGKGKSEEKESFQQVLKYVAASDPRHMDPGLNSEAVAGSLINNLFEGLLRERKGVLSPGIARDYEVSEDKKVYTFYLRDSKWSDGTSLTSKDFKYSWLRAMAPETASTYAMLFFQIEGAQAYYEGKGKQEDVGIETPDDKTLIVRLAAPTPYFLNLTTFYTFMPVKKEVVERLPDTWTSKPETYISNGPFRLSKYDIGSKFLLEKNPEYWNAEEVKLSMIEVPIITDESTSLTAFETGEVDIISNIPTQEIVRLSTESQDFYVKPGVGTYFYVFNNKKAPTDNIYVKKALNYAINRRAIVDNITRGGETPATTYVPSTDAIKNSKGELFAKGVDYGIPVEGDPQKARALLAEAGYPNGEGFPTLELLYNTSETHKAIAEAVQAMWKDVLNIDVELINQEWGVFLNTRGKGQYNGVARFGWSIDYPDAMSMLEVFESLSGNNSAQWVRDEYNDLLTRAKYEEDGEKRDELLYNAEEMLFEEQVLIPLYYYTNKFMVKSKVKSWERTSLGNWYFGGTYTE